MTLMIQTLSFIPEAGPAAGSAKPGLASSADAMAGSVAHDLNNILQIIGGNLSMLALELGDSKAAKRYIASALAGVDLGTRLARRTLTKGGIERLEAPHTDLKATLMATKQLVLDAVGDGVAVNFHVCDPLGPICIDHTELQNAIINLAINARDAMNGLGELTVVAAGNRNGLAVSVSDTGCGMAPEVVAQAFQPLFTTKGVNGSGLGLAAVKRFVDESGGTVCISSRVGEGTTVNLRFPRHSQREQRASDHVRFAAF